MRIILQIIFHLPAILFLAGCIHTYPSPGEDVDPTEINVSLQIHVDEEWERQSFQLTKTSRATSLRRLYIDIRNSNSQRECLTRKISSEEISDGAFVLQLPMKFKAQRYRIALWYDFLDSSGADPVAYEISTDNYVRELRPRGEESDFRTCLTAVKEIDLGSYTGKWHVNEEIPLTLTSPMARWRIMATDYQEFLDQTAERRLRGERYYILLSYDSEIPGSFALHEGLAMEPVKGARFTLPLSILTMPGIEMCVASDWLINPVGPHQHTVTVSVLNSALALVSKTSEISFPTERGKLTTISGKVLTNFITGGISIDNLWDDEIVIEVN